MRYIHPFIIPTLCVNMEIGGLTPSQNTKLLVYVYSFYISSPTYLIGDDYFKKLHKITWEYCICKLIKYSYLKMIYLPENDNSDKKLGLYGRVVLITCYELWWNNKMKNKVTHEQNLIIVLWRWNIYLG